MNFLNRLSILQLTIVGVAILTASLAFLVIKDISRSFSMKANAELDIQLISLLDSIEKVAHNHAVERGLTAGYLGKPSSEAKQKVDAQRIKANEAVDHMLVLMENEWPSEIHVIDKLRALQGQIGKKTNIRGEVDRNFGQNAFVYYSRLNAMALNAANSLMLSVNDPNSKEDLAHALLFAQLKERMGQLRGKANGVLAKQQINGALKEELATYYNEIQYVSEKLNYSLTGEFKDDFQSVMNSSDTQRIDQIAEELLAEDTNFTSLPSNSQWFAMATQQIGQIKGLLDRKWNKIKEEAADKQASEDRMLVANIVIVVLVIVTLIIIYRTLFAILSRQLQKLTDNLNKIADNGDLTIDVSLRSDNELGSISRSVNKTILALKDLISGLDQSIATSSRLSSELDTSSSSMLQDAGETQQKAMSIASAIEEMAATSGEIARSSIDTLEASKGLDTLALEAQSANDDIRKAMEQLRDDMQEVESNAGAMEQQVSEISSILETINTLSDQTNLLALNAAIEAARAGEHGRGFAVVADEVRKLAQGSRESSDKISSLLSTLQDASIIVVKGISKNTEAARNSVAVTEVGETTAKQVQQAASNVEQMANSMSAAAEQQSTTASQVAQDILGVQDAASHEVEIARALKELSDNMQANNAVLQLTMDNFKIE